LVQLCRKEDFLLWDENKFARKAAEFSAILNFSVKIIQFCIWLNTYPIDTENRILTIKKPGLAFLLKLTTKMSKIFSII